MVQKHDLLESETICVHFLEKSLSQLPPGEEKILGIFDLQGFTLQNGDLTFIKFLVLNFYLCFLEFDRIWISQFGY